MLFPLPKMFWFPSAWWFLIHSLTVSLQVSLPLEKDHTDPIEVTTTSVLLLMNILYNKILCVFVSLQLMSVSWVQWLYLILVFSWMYLYQIFIFIFLYIPQKMRTDIKQTSELVYFWTSALDLRGLNHILMLIPLPVTTPHKDNRQCSKQKAVVGLSR